MAMIDRSHSRMSLSAQCKVLQISRASLYYRPKDESAQTLALMRRIDELFMQYPFYGSRQIVQHLAREGIGVGRHWVRRLMRLMGLQAIHQAPLTSQPHPRHKIYPYLLKDLVITGPNQVWCPDITYIPMQRGFLYLVAIMDWATRKVLAWRLSNTMDVRFCVDTLDDAMRRYGKPSIFNTDQGSQFTSAEFTGRLLDAKIQISMPLGECVHSPAGNRRSRTVHGQPSWRLTRASLTVLAQSSSGFGGR